MVREWTGGVLGVWGFFGVKGLLDDGFWLRNSEAFRNREPKVSFSMAHRILRWDDVDYMSGLSAKTTEREKRPGGCLNLVNFVTPLVFKQTLRQKDYCQFNLSQSAW